MKIEYVYFIGRIKKGVGILTDRELSIFDIPSMLGFIDYIKIGKAIDVKLRFSGIQTGCPEQLFLIGYTDILKEHEFHSLFLEFNFRGEWFECSDFIKSYIMEQIEFGNILTGDCWPCRIRKSSHWENDYLKYASLANSRLPGVSQIIQFHDRRST